LPIWRAGDADCSWERSFAGQRIKRLAYSLPPLSLAALRLGISLVAGRAHGFIDKLRRTRRTGRSAWEGLQREQITNTYTFATKLAATVQQRFAQLVGGRKRAEAIQARKKAEAA
jgi:hypothetical protein